MYTVVVTAVCVSVCVDVTWGNGRGYPLVVHYWADLQSVHGFRCYDNIAPEMRDVSEYLYSLYTWLKFAIPVISLELVKLGTTNLVCTRTLTRVGHSSKHVSLLANGMRLGSRDLWK